MNKILEAQTKECRERWFKDHEATVITDNPSVTIINWQKADSWNYGCRFIIHSHWLLVVGDIGEAVYQWSQRISAEFLSELNFDYFHGKCVASEDGRQFNMWDHREAYRLVQEWLAEADANNFPTEEDDERRHLRNITEHTDRQEFEELVRKAYDEGLDDCETAAYLSGCGLVPHPRCVGHFVGLQMAIAQLNKKGIAV